mgnify:CR=1 FL=1
MLLLSSLPKATPTNDLRELMLLPSSLPQVAPTNDLGESMLLLSSLAAPGSERGERMALSVFPFFVTIQHMLLLLLHNI